MARDRKRHAGEQEASPSAAPAAALPSGSALAPTQVPPHPALIQLVRLLARQAAAAEIAAPSAARIVED